MNWPFNKWMTHTHTELHLKNWSRIKFIKKKIGKFNFFHDDTLHWWWQNLDLQVFFFSFLTLLKIFYLINLQSIDWSELIIKRIIFREIIFISFGNYQHYRLWWWWWAAIIFIIIIIIVVWPSWLRIGYYYRSFFSG